MTFFRKRSLLESQKLLRRGRAKEMTKAISIFILFCGLLWGLSALSYSSKLTVQTILVSGNQAVPTDEVVSIAYDTLQGRIGLIFSKANILLYQKYRIMNTLKYSYSWIDTVSISRVNTTTISIKIKERVPVAVWCGVSLEKTQPCKLMDAQGYLIDKAPEFSGAVYIKLYGPLTSASWRGAGFFSEEGLTHILEFTKALPEIGFQPVSAVVTSANTYDVFLINGAYVSVPTSDSVSTIVSNIDLLLKQKIFAQSQTSNFSNLLYIDARFGNKLFYKFK